jgi:hypothetical protein
MKSLPLLFLGYLILCPHVFFSWRDWLRTKGGEAQKKKSNLQWNLWLGTLSLALWMALTVESFTNEFSILWFLNFLLFTVLFLIWSIKFMPDEGGRRA